MTAALLDRRRHLLPRWRSPRLAAVAGELSTRPNTARVQHLEAELEHRLRSVDSARPEDVLSAVVELLIAARAANEKEVAQTARNLILGDQTASIALRDTVEALDLRSAPSPNDPAAIIANARRRLLHQPHSPITWMELARGRLLLGDTRDARRALLVARNLAPTDRLISRAYARFLVHESQFDEAHALLARHPRLVVDPWLQASEIAVARLAGRTAVSLSRVRYDLRSRTTPVTEWSELSAAVATAEFEAGNSGRARSLMRLAIEGGHDNALAQALSLQRDGLRVSDEALEEKVMRHPLGFEARMQRAFIGADWEGVWSEGRQWQEDQGFSTQPSYVLTVVASVGLLDPERTLEAAQMGLAAKASDATVRNNHAYALLLLGRTTEASAILDSVQSKLETLPLDERTALTATKGLLAYRTGNEALGAALYTEAARLAESGGRKRTALAATLYHEWMRAQLKLPPLAPAAVDRPTADPILKAIQRHIKNEVVVLRPSSLGQTQS